MPEGNCAYRRIVAFTSTVTCLSPIGRLIARRSSALSFSRENQRHAVAQRGLDDRSARRFAPGLHRRGPSRVCSVRSQIESCLSASNSGSDVDVERHRADGHSASDCDRMEPPIPVGDHHAQRALRRVPLPPRWSLIDRSIFTLIGWSRRGGGAAPGAAAAANRSRRCTRRRGGGSRLLRQRRRNRQRRRRPSSARTCRVIIVDLLRSPRRALRRLRDRRGGW